MAAACLLSVPSASAQIIKIKPRVHSACKNSNATPHCLKRSSDGKDCIQTECRHKTKYYTYSACESGWTYSGGKCKASGHTNITTPKCSVGNWKHVMEKKDKCYSKKNGQGKYKGYISCSGLSSKSHLVDYNGGKEDKCGKAKTGEKTRKATKCPTGFVKGSQKKTGSNGYVQYYCNTI